MENLPAEKLYPTIRLSKNKKSATLKLGDAQCELSLTELSDLARVAISRINELVKKQRLEDSIDPNVQQYWHNDFITRKINDAKDRYAKINNISIEDAENQLREYYNKLWPLTLKTK